MFALLVAAPNAVRAAGYTFTNIVDSTGRFSERFGLPSINATRAVAFYAAVDTGSDGIFSAHGGAITRIARLSQVPHLSYLNRETPINASGRVAFIGKISGKGDGLFSGRGGPLKTLAIAPKFSDFRGIAAINDAGQVCFSADFRNGNQDIFISERDGAITTVIPSGIGGFAASLPAAINETATVAFRAWF